MDLKMTKTNHKPNTDPNPNPRQTLILIYVHNFHPNPFKNPKIRNDCSLLDANSNQWRPVKYMITIQPLAHGYK